MGKNDTKSARQPMAGNVGATEPEPRWWCWMKHSADLIL
jgi:hypothetical protein